MEILKGKVEKQKRNMTLGIRHSAITETLLFLTIFTVASYAFSDGSRFISVFPHPFWIILLMVIVQYGANEGLMCALLCSIFLTAFNIPIQRLDENIYDYMLNIALRPILWFSAAVVLGQLRARHINEKRDVIKKYKNAEHREITITNAYNNLKEIKELLEIRLASQLSSTATAYDAIKKIETLSQSRVLLGVEDIVASVLNPKKFSIYGVGPTGFQSATCTGWHNDERYSRRFDITSDMYLEVAGKKRMLCAINVKDSNILRNEGVLAAPLIDSKNQEIFGMLKIEQLDFTELTLTNVETFRILCEWIGMAYANAGKYEEARDKSFVNPQSGLLSYNFFIRQHRHIARLVGQSGLEAYLVEVKLQNIHDFDKDEQYKVASSFNKIAKKIFPKSSEIFEGGRYGMEMLIIIEGFAKQKVDALIRSLKKTISLDIEKPLKNAEFSFAMNRIDGVKETRRNNKADSQ